MISCFFFRVVNFTQLHEKTMIENVYYLNTILGTNSASRNNIWYNKKKLRNLFASRTVNVILYSFK